MFKASLRLLSKTDKILNESSLDYLRILKSLKQSQLKVKLLLIKEFNAPKNNFSSIPDRDKLKFSANRSATKEKTYWFRNENKTCFQSVLMENDSLWTLEMAGHIFQVLNTYFKDEISIFDEKINQLLINITENLEKCDICTLAMVIESSITKNSTFFPVISQAFSEKFKNEKDWEIFSLDELFYIFKVINDGLIDWKVNPENCKKMFERIMYHADNNFINELNIIEEFISYQSLNDCEYLKDLHRLIGLKIYESLTFSGTWKLYDATMIYLKVLKVLLVPREVKNFLSNILINNLFQLFLRVEKTYNSYQDFTLISSICSLMIRLRIFSPDILIRLYLMIGTENYEMSQKYHYGKLLEVYAFFNIRDWFIYSKVETKQNLDQIIDNLLEKEIKYSESLIEKKGSLRIFKHLTSFLWSFFILNPQKSIDYSAFINYLNNQDIVLSYSLNKKITIVRNYIKHILKHDQELKTFEYNSIKLPEFNKDNDSEIIKEFKNEVAEIIDSRLKPDLKVEDMEVDFLNPDRKLAVFLVTNKNSTKFDDKVITLGDQLLTNKILTSLKYKVEKVDIEDLINYNEGNQNSILLRLKNS